MNPDGVPSAQVMCVGASVWGHIPTGAAAGQEARGPADDPHKQVELRYCQRGGRSAICHQTQ